MKTVMWFNISAELSNEEVAGKLGPGLSVENGGGKELKLIWSGTRAIGCRTTGNLLKIFLSERRFIRRAKNSFGKEAGLS